MERRPTLLLISTFGLGYLRPASGTWGSLPPVVLALAMEAAGLGPGTHPVVFNAVLAAVLVIFSAACVVQGDAAEARWGKDPSNVVADETAGQCIPLMFLPAGAVVSLELSLFTLALAFIAFRVLDILKPWPANRLQDIPGGWGILLDDLVAGVYAMVIVQVCSRGALG
ncbi:phosphatidylglycerophosphatase A [Phycisphaerales bacterium]|nr:phosphatidylglycerophosphatase A [Phycisphaerales bacterium]